MGKGAGHANQRGYGFVYCWHSHRFCCREARCWHPMYGLSARMTEENAGRHLLKAALGRLFREVNNRAELRHARLRDASAAEKLDGLAGQDNLLEAAIKQCSTLSTSTDSSS